MAVREAPSWLQNGSHSAEDDRLLLQSLLGGSPNQALTPGIVGVADLAVTQNGTPNMSVNVASGAAFIAGTQSSMQGVYNLINDASLNVVISTANATNPRIDLIVAQILDDQYSGASHLGQIVVVTGTPAASPSAPATPANSIVLAQIAVGAAVTSIVTANITDKRAVFSTTNRVVAGHLASNFNCTTGLATWLTTGVLSVGTWLVNVSAFVNIGASSNPVELTTALGTATGTFEGAISAQIDGSLGFYQGGYTFIVTVTAAGTLVFQQKTAATTGTPFIGAVTLTSSYVKASGYTALKIF